MIDYKSGLRVRSLHTHSITVIPNKISYTYNNYIKHINYQREQLPIRALAVLGGSIESVNEAASCVFMEDNKSQLESSKVIICIL